MKFLCIDCDTQMTFDEGRDPGDGTLAAAFKCPRCQRRVALLANPMESQLVGALGVQLGGRTLDARPFESVRSSIVGPNDAFQDIEDRGSAPARHPSAAAAPGTPPPGSVARGGPCAPPPLKLRRGSPKLVAMDHRATSEGGPLRSLAGAPGVPPTGPQPRWTVESQKRLERVPTVVRGMVVRAYVDWARERGITEITPDVMDRARAELGLEGP